MANRKSIASMSSVDSSDADFFAISFCPASTEPLPLPLPHALSSSSSSASSDSDSDSISEIPSPASSRPVSYILHHSSSQDSDRDLWNCMLEIQQRYGCYRSARLEAALALDSEDLMPSRPILDLMNENVASMPEEAQKSLSRFIRIPEPEPARPPKKHHLRFWRNRA